MTAAKDEQQELTEEQIESVRDEFCTFSLGYNPDAESKKAACLILQARAERDEARRYLAHADAEHKRCAQLYLKASDERDVALARVRYWEGQAADYKDMVAQKDKWLAALETENAKLQARLDRIERVWDGWQRDLINFGDGETVSCFYKDMSKAMSHE
jgi:hypothetical protein